jgi:hypothetical protein
MTEREMKDEIERLRAELAEANKSRERLREMICAILPVAPPEVMEREIEEMMRNPPSDITDIIADMMSDRSEGEGRQIPA